MQRRQALKLLGGGLLVAGTGRAAQNTLIGYGKLTGTNLVEQDLHPLVAERLGADAFTATVDGYDVSVSGDDLTLAADGDELETLSVTESTPEEGAAVDAEYDLSGGPVEQLVRDVAAIRAGEYRIEASGYETFFERLHEVDPRPFSVGVTRYRYSGADPDVVEEFLGAPPTDPERVVVDLVAAFREHTNYDTQRYLAGSVEDNVLMGQVDLRQHFESPTDFAAIMEGDNSGLFCTELTRRSAEALLAVPAHEATLPVVAGYVYNRRHKHVYTIIASLYRQDGELVFPITFVDYTDTTQHDDYRLRWLLGEGLDAYDTSHRATTIYW